MKDSTFIFLIITIIVIFILHVRFKIAEPQEFPEIKVSGVSLMSKSTENYVPWKTEMFTDDIYKSMSEGVEIKFNISIDSGASTIKELIVTRTRKDDSTIEETKTINGPFENEKSFDFTFTGKGNENFIGEHIFRVKYKLPYGDELFELEDEFSTNIVGADLAIATEILKYSAHTLRIETKKKVTFDKSSDFKYLGNFGRLDPHVGWDYFNYTILPDERANAIKICADKCDEITEGDGCPGFAIDFRTDGSVNCMPYIAKQVNYLPPGREVCRINPELQNPDDGQGPCSTENVMGTYGGYEGGLHWRDLSIGDEVTSRLSIGPGVYGDVGTGFCSEGQIESSVAWALLEPGESREQAGFDSPLYEEYLRRGIEKCNANENCTHVSVWQDAGYRIYNSTDDCANKQDTGGIVKSWKKPTSYEESRAVAEAAEAEAKAKAEAEAKAKAEAEAKAKAEAEAKAAERERINNLGTYIVDKSLPFEYRKNFSRLDSQTGWGYINHTISGPPKDAVKKCGEKCNEITEGDGCPGFAIDFRTDGSVNCMPYIAKQVNYLPPGREQCRHHPEEQEPVDGQGPCSTENVMGTYGGYEGGLHWRKSREAQGDDVQDDFTAGKMDSDISDIEPIPKHCTDENGDLLQDPLIEGSNTKYDPNKTYQFKNPGHDRHYQHYCRHFIKGPALDNIRDTECARHLCYNTAFGNYGVFENGDGGGLCAGECWDRFKREPYQDPVSPDCKMTNRSLTYEDWIGWKRWIPPEIYGTDGELVPSSDPGRERAWIAQARIITKPATGDGKKCCERLGRPITCVDPSVGEKLFQIERVVSRSDESAVTIDGQHMIDYFYDKNKFTAKCENEFIRAYGEGGPTGDTKDCSPEAQYIARSIEKHLNELATDEDKERYLGSSFSDPDAWGEIIGGHLNDYYKSGGARQPFWQQT